jgi:hypothetical protein
MKLIRNVLATVVIVFMIILCIYTFYIVAILAVAGIIFMLVYVGVKSYFEDKKSNGKS